MTSEYLYIKKSFDKVPHHRVLFRPVRLRSVLACLGCYVSVTLRYDEKVGKGFGYKTGHFSITKMYGPIGRGCNFPKTALHNI